MCVCVLHVFICSERKMGHGVLYLRPSHCATHAQNCIFFSFVVKGNGKKEPLMASISSYAKFLARIV